MRDDGRGADCGRVRRLVLAGASAEPSGAAATAFLAFAWALGAAPQRPLDALNTWIFQRVYPRPRIAEPIVADGCSFARWRASRPDAPRVRFRERLLSYGRPRSS